MTTGFTVPAARFARRPARGVMLGYSGWRLAALGLAGLCILFGLLSGTGGAGLVASLLMASPLVAAAYVRVAGRHAVEWLPVAGHWQARRLAGQTVYRAKVATPRPVGTMALPGDAASLRFYIPEGREVAMIHDPHRQTLAAVLHVEHPAYVLLSPGQQASRPVVFGRVLASLAQSGTTAGLQILEATIPDSGEGIVEWYRTHGDPAAPAFVADQYRELVETLAHGATTHRTTLTLVLDLKAASGAVKAAGGGIAGAGKVLLSDMTALEYALSSAEVRFSDWMTEPELAAIVRCAYDPAVADRFRPGDPGANLHRAGPLAVDEEWSHLRHDSGYTTVLWISEWPRIEVNALFLHSLVFSGGVRKTLSILYHPLMTDAALRKIRRQKADAISDARQKAKVGQVEDLSDAQEFADLEARERALISGHADVEFTGLLAVTAATETQLAEAVKQVERAAIQSGCETRVLAGQQAQAFVSAALPLGRLTV